MKQKNYRGTTPRAALLARALKAARFFPAAAAAASAATARGGLLPALPAAL